MAYQLDPYLDPHIKYPLPDEKSSYQAYIDQCKPLILQNRQDHFSSFLHSPILQANLPFELIPPHFNAKNGILLIHGLLDSPSIMRDIATHLANQGFLVRTILLPGHGTVPGALLHVHYQDWLETVRAGVRGIASQVDHLFLGGFSTGAGLALYHTLETLNEKTTPANVKGLLLISPPIKILSRMDFAAGIINKWARWFTLQPENDYARYRSIPFNAINQVYLLTQLIKKRTQEKKLSVPVFFCLSMQDEVLSAKAALHYYRNLTHPQNALLLFSDKPYTEKINNLIFQLSSHPEKKIRHLSHIAIPIAMHNPHYGIEGDYELASHINEPTSVQYGAYRLKEYASAFFTRNAYQRLTFNPDFTVLTREIDRFLQPLISF